MADSDIERPAAEVPSASQGAGLHAKSNTWLCVAQALNSWRISLGRQCQLVRDCPIVTCVALALLGLATASSTVPKQVSRRQHRWHNRLRWAHDHDMRSWAVGAHFRDLSHDELYSMPCAQDTSAAVLGDGVGSGSPASRWRALLKSSACRQFQIRDSNNSCGAAPGPCAAV